MKASLLAVIINREFWQSSYSILYITPRSQVERAPQLSILIAECSYWLVILFGGVFLLVGYSFWRSVPIGWFIFVAKCSYWLVFPFDGVFLLVGYLVFLAECSYWLFIPLACHVSQLTGYNILCTNLLLSVSVT